MKTIPTNKQTIEYLKGRLDDVPLDGKWYVEIKKVKSRRKIDQNAMYWAWMSYLSEYHAGTKADKNWYHEGFKRKFLEPKMINRFGKEREHYTTTDMDEGPFAQYMKDVYNDCLLFGITLPKKVGKEYDQMMEVYGG